MKALLLAAGLGTRLQPLTNDIPKCLISIDGKPLLEYWITLLYHSDVFPLLVNLYHHADKVKNFINNSPYKKFIFTVHEEKLLGTGGTLLRNREFFNNEPLMLVHADNLSIFDVHAFINSHKNRPRGCEITMMTFKTPTPKSCGIIETDEKGRVQAFHEKADNPPGDLANGAVYIVEPTLFNYLESLDKEFIDFSTEVIPNFIGRINTFFNDVYHRDIGTTESYEAACREYPAIINKINIFLQNNRNNNELVIKYQ
jgi:mannose-1-phosphate guanylyltransferase